MKKHLLTFLLFVMGFAASAQVILTGQVTDETGEPAVGALIVVKKNDVIKYSGTMDLDGYRITNIDPGTYDVEFRQAGSSTQIQKNVVLTTGIINLNSKLDAGLMTEFVVTESKVAIVKVDQTQQGGSITSAQIMKMPTRDISGLVGSIAGVSTSPTDGAVTIKGARANQTDYYVDGMRVRGQTPSVQDIEQLTVITGGLPARYGDVTGGVISITTKGPAQKLSGGVEVESSQFLDNYGYNLANVNLSGPILQRDRGTYKESVIGFRMSGSFQNNLDRSPPATPIYKVKPDVLAQLEANPITTIAGGTPVAAAELLQTSDFDIMKYRPGNKYARYDFNGKLDFKVTKAIDVSVGGNYFGIADQLTPADGDGRTWTVFNSDHNPTDKSSRWRTNVRLRHRLGNTDTDAKTKRTSTYVSNAQYTLQASYEQSALDRKDPIHGDNYFNYGYIGQFDYGYAPVFGARDTGAGPPVFYHAGYQKRLNNYKRSEVNPVLANYNNGIEVSSSDANFRVLNGVYNLSNVNRVFNFHQNVGQVYNNVTKNQGNLLIGQATINFDINPNGNKNNAHNIEVGFLYERRIDRSWTLNPFALWNLAEISQNRNFNGTGLDTSAAGYLRDSTFAGQTVKIYRPLLNNEILNQTDLGFYQRYRAKTGLSQYTYGNVNNLTPDQMSLDMFTARELNDQQLIDYYGYDYLGNPLGTDVTFRDFFEKKDATGTRTFPVAPLSPQYASVYLMDKFRYKDMIFSIGGRAEYFDANTKVLKDPYTLYEGMSAKDFYTNVLKTDKPSNIGDDYRVYLTEQTYGKIGYNYTPTTIKAFRQGDQWYNASGAAIDPINLFGETGQAQIKYFNDQFSQIKDLGYEPDNSFVDYIPQLNFVPRLAFSFPIAKNAEGEETANFFAHYDILVSRPSSNNGVTALDYYYFDDNGRTPENNANLKPERTIDYEVGFQQLLTKTSGIKFSAYYKEMRDMIQLRYYRYLPKPLKITEYLSYDNLDFGTVKGFTFQYDMRRTKHLELRLDYTLQFADGTGSDASSQRNINRRGNIRVLSPVSYDERHRISAVIDYRYNEDKYTGPQLFGYDIFKNAGLNVQMLTVSGRPYTARLSPLPFSASQISGGINASRLPWIFNVDMRLDKTFTLNPKAKKPLDLNVYFRVSNLLNRQNVTRVYTASGVADNDGYFATSRGQSDLSGTRLQRGELGLQSYIASYNMRMLNPDFYSLPRRMYIGAIFNF